MKCPEQVEQFKKNGLPISESMITFTDDCKFVPKQCNSDKCWCVKVKTGERTFSPLEVPLNESYGCTSKLKLNINKIFSFIFYFACYLLHHNV